MGKLENLKRGDKLDANGQSHNWNVHNGRKFGKRYGRKGGKARWASMTQEEKELIWAKRDYAIEQNSRLKARMSKMSLTPAKNLSRQEIEEYEEFFGDIL
jgi:hypothetical protein